ncbi:retrovirus-related pol polyprotein from transposon TNT 1-94 [Tanacetum coccineum]
MRLIQSLASKELVTNLPKLKFDQHFCNACKIGKQAHASHKAKNIVSTTRCLKLLHMDLFSPSVVRSYGGNLYTLVMVDDYFRTDHDREFYNEVQFGEFCNVNGITHNFSAPHTPQSNDTSTYILNQILIRVILLKTPYELLGGRKPTLDYFKVFGSKWFILNTKDYLTKFDPKLYKGVFLGYSQNSKAYIILNKHTIKIEESLNLTFDETPPPSITLPLMDDDLNEEEAIKVTEKNNIENDIEEETLEVDKIVNIKESKNHPLDNVIGNLNQRTLKSQAQNQSNFFCFISTIEPKNVNEALNDKGKTRKDYGTKRGRHSTSASASFAFDHPSFSHHVDDDNDEGTSRVSTPSPTHFVNSLLNEIPQVFSNPPHDDQNMETFFTRQTKILNRQVQMRDEHRSGLRSIEKGINNLLKGNKK